MKSSEFRQITDELLSAYLDNAVTDQERALIEAAVAVEPDIAWRLDSLRQTVMLLRELPELPLPRRFTLQEAQVSDVLVARAPVARRATGRVAARADLWSNFVAGWRSFWQAGNPMLRNAMATSLVLLLLLTGGSQLLSSQFETVGAPIIMAPAPASMPSAAQEAAAPASEPAAGEAAPMMAEEAPAEEAAEPEAAVAMAEPTSEPAPTREAEESGEALEGAAPVIATASVPADGPAPESDETDPAAEQPAGEPPTAEQPNPDAGTGTEDAEAGEAASGEDAMAEAAAMPPMVEAQPEAAPVPGGGGPPPGAPGMAAFPFDPAARGGGGPGMGGAGGGPGDPAVPYADGLLPPEAYSTDPALAPVEPMTVESGADASVAAVEAEEPAPAESATTEPATGESATEESTAVAMALPPATETPAVKSVAGDEEAPAASPTVAESVSLTETAPVTESGILTEALAEPVAEPIAESPPVAAGAQRLIQLAQLSLGLLTVMLASLWWRSRRSRDERT